jgi:hypothetical protein
MMVSHAAQSRALARDRHTAIRGLVFMMTSKECIKAMSSLQGRRPPKGPDHGFRIRAAPNVAMGKAA